MSRVVAIGKQDFCEVIEQNCFYIDKTGFIKEWWENQDDVTLITRPRRFGKTLSMSMVEQFFSVTNADSVLFQDLAIWQEEAYRSLQGTYPVIFLSFADIKDVAYEDAYTGICQIIADAYLANKHLLDGNTLNTEEKRYFLSVNDQMKKRTAVVAIRRLSGYLHQYYGKKVIILLDEYDAPMQEAYTNGYWEELSEFMRGFFNATFKTNRSMERAILTGITRVGKESIFSDLNNLEVVATTSQKYEAVFGFTEEEVFCALEEYGLSDKKQQVKEWYDGFTFGRRQHVYNPWSITHFLEKREFKNYWANTSSNALVSNLLQKSSQEVKLAMEGLMEGTGLRAEIDEEVVFSQLGRTRGAIWSLFLASGYLKVTRYQIDEDSGRQRYELDVTNKEVKLMFSQMFINWFEGESCNYSLFSKALIAGNVEQMNRYLDEIAMATFSYFDTGYRQAENFYHAFVLGLVAELSPGYEITSNRESGLGRYDVMLMPKDDVSDGILIEFKVYDPQKEKTLQDTVARALAQIEEKKYETVLKQRGLSSSRIKKYGFAFRGKEVCIGGGPPLSF